MQSKNLENYIEFLLSAALQRCGNIYDAEDLTQETLLTALSYMARGKDIQDVKAWLLVVMGRKFNDMLRKRYKQPIVSIGDDFNIVDENALIQLNDESDESESVRKAVAYLTAPYAEPHDVRITYIFDPDSESKYPTYDRYRYVDNHLYTFTTNEAVYGMPVILETMQKQLDAKACEDTSAFEVTYPVYLDDEAEAIREEK